MHRFLNKDLVAGYKSASQKIRVLTEEWVGKEIFCPSCGTCINRYGNNRPVADFYCSVCNEDYELKGKGRGFGSKIVDGAFRTTIERLNSNLNPNLFLLAYNPKNFEILNFCVIPKYFFVPQIIEERKPLSKNARRPGWVGCNILLDNIPQTGRIFYIKDKVLMPYTTVLANWKKTLFLKEEPRVKERSWIIDIMNCIEKLDQEFSLSEVYSFEDELQGKHARNFHIRDKIRQQLQILRDVGYLEFLGHGRYKKV
ncbi:MAG: DpnI domain-containing protein [Dehalococcoidales bacterium]|nr:DpnI domain-containing protein [Dehalococcoidales bacterium]